MPPFNRFFHGEQHGEFGPFGKHGPGRGHREGWREFGRFGFGGRGGPRVDRGEVKFLILSVLQEGPKHGYEIMRSIEEKSQGAYTPSAGTVYPTLQMLEDLGQIRGLESEGRKVYELTEAGRAYVATHQAEVNAAWERFAQPAGRGEEARQLREELGMLARALFAEGRIFRADSKTLSRVRDILKNAREQVDVALAEYV
ncbi:MAG TPA: PadR family transcriptional regulator [Chloroflexota bacterium]|nr:PadR family transcriptional regulator [Chloroflexota bacterium]